MARMNFRGQHAIVLHRAGSDSRTLCEQLHRLGLTTQVVAANSGVDFASAQICFFDVDAALDSLFLWPRGNAPFPLVALIGSETRARLDWMLTIEPDAVLNKPIRSSGIYGALVIADHAFARKRRIGKEMDDLNERIRARRLIFHALIRLMMEHDLNETTAYARLRAESQNRQMSIEQMCAQIVGCGSGESLDQIEIRITPRAPKDSASAASAMIQSGVANKSCP